MEFSYVFPTACSAAKGLVETRQMAPRMRKSMERVILQSALPPRGCTVGGRTGSEKTMISTLFLHEELVLLALKDEEGTIASGAMYRHAIGGAILAELLLDDRIRIVEPKKKKKLVELVSATPLGDALIDECLARIRDSKKRRSAQDWVSKFANMKNLKHRVADQLVNRGILRGGEGRVLGIFNRKIYPEVNAEPETELIGRMREAIFTDTHDVDPRTVVLVSLANATNILKVPFDKKKLKERKKRIEQVVNGEVTGKAAKEAVEAMRAAIMVAVFVPLFVAASD